MTLFRGGFLAIFWIPRPQARLQAQPGSSLGPRLGLAMIMASAPAPVSAMAPAQSLALDGPSLGFGLGSSPDLSLSLGHGTGSVAGLGLDPSWELRPADPGFSPGSVLGS